MRQNNLTFKLPKITLTRSLIAFALVYLCRHLLYSRIHDASQKITFDQGIEDGMAQAEILGIESAVSFFKSYDFNLECKSAIKKLEKPIREKASALNELFQVPYCYVKDYYPEGVKLIALVDFCDEDLRKKYYVSLTKERLELSNKNLAQSEKELKEICQRDPILSMPADVKNVLDQKALSKLKESTSFDQILSFSMEILLTLSIMAIGWELFKLIEKNCLETIETVGFENQKSGNVDLQKRVQEFNEKKLDKKLLPKTFLCPISKEILTKPVLLASDVTGRRYQLEKLSQFLKRRRVYPNSETEISMDRIILTRDRWFENLMIEKIKKILNDRATNKPEQNKTYQI